MEAKRALVKRYVFGTNHDGENCIHWMDDGSLLYPVGKTVVLQQPHSCHQRFLEAAYQSSAITAIAMSTNKKFVAIAESGEHPQIQIIDTVTRKRRKILSVAELDSDRYVALSFSSDGRHLVTQGGRPGWNLYFWNWERSQPLGSVSVAQVYHSTQQASPDISGQGERGAGGGTAQQHRQQLAGARPNPLSADAAASRTRSSYSREAPMVVSSIGVCPHDPLLVSVAGNGFFRFYRYTDGLLQPQPSTGIPREQYEVFSTHLWITPHNVVASTRSGSLHLIQDGRYITTMNLPSSAGPRLAGRVGNSTNESQQLTGEGSDVVTCIVPTHPKGHPRSGFIAATNRGNLFIFEEAQTAMSSSRRENNNFSTIATAGGSGAEDDEDTRDALSYCFVCRLEVPVYEAGELHLLQQQQAPRSRSQMVVIDSQAGSGQQQQKQTNDETSLAGPRHCINRRSGEGSKGTGSTTAAGVSGKERVSKLFELRHETKADEMTITGTGTDKSRENGQNKKGSLHSDRVGGLMSGGGDGNGGGVGPFGGVSGSSNANDVSSPKTEEQRCRQRILAIALDQAEERLAVLTASGKLYGLNFQQNWQKREEMFVTAALNGGNQGSNSVAAFALRSSGISTEDGSPVQPFLSSASALRPQHAQPFLLQHQPRASLFEPLYPFSHSGRVNGMDCSVRKPLLITSGSDHSVRVWNTQSGQLLMCQFFPLQPGAVAIHPDGLVAVVCFPDKVRVMSVLSSSLRERRTINLRNATDVQFALGGQLFAIVHNNLVDVLNTNTCELYGQLRGHPQRIKDFQWCSTTPYPTDNRAVTCSADGMIMDWNIAEMRKQAEHTDKRFQYVAVASDDRSVWVVAAPTSATAIDVSWKVLLREIDRQSLGTSGSGTTTGAGGSGAGRAAGGNNAGSGAFAGSIQSNSVGDYEFTETVLTSLAVAPHQRVLVAGAEDGSVKAITFPLQAGIQEAPLTAHALPVTRMAISFDEMTLFTAAADGSVMMWEVYPEREKTKASAAAAAAGATAAVSTAVTGGGGTASAGLIGAGASSQHQDPASRQVLSGGEEVLVTRQEMEEHRIEIENLQQYIEKLKTDMESEDKRRAHEQGTRTREKAEELQQIAVTLAAEYDALHHAKVDQEKTFLDVKTEKEREAAERLEDLEIQRQREVDELEEECATLQHTLETTKTAHVEELRELQEQLAKARQEDEAHYQDVLAQRTEAIHKLRRLLEQSQETNRVTLRQLELDTDAESQSVQQKQQQALQGARERYLHLKGEGAVMRKNASRLEREIEVRTNELQLLDGAKVALQAQLAALTHQVAQLHQDIDERDSVTEKKEKIIYSLKKQNQELEKYKYVLDHQIRELKGQIEPKQREIAELNQETKNQNANLEEQHANNMTLRENTEELKKDIAEQQQTLQAHLRELKRLQTYRSRAERDIGELAHQLQDPAALAAAITHLYEVHVAPQDVEQIAPADPQVKHELQSQLEYLSTSVDALRRKLKADQQRHKKEVSAMMSENLSLIREIHSLRAEMDHLRTRVASDTALKQKQQHQQQLRRGPGGRGRGGRGSNGPGSLSTIRRASAARGTADASLAAETAGTSATNVGGSSSRVVGYPQSEVESNATVATGVTRCRGGPGTSMQRPPTPPAEIETNTNELRALRVYIDALERTLSEHAASKAACAASVRLPPVDPFVGT